MDKARKDLINKRKIAYVYLLHRMFEGAPALMLKVMKFKDITIADLEDWNIDYKEAVYKVIEEEDAHGVEMGDPVRPVPSIKSIKDRTLRRMNDIIDATDDPARLATVFKVLSDFDEADDKAGKNVLDAINEAVSPRSEKSGPKPKTMLTRMRKNLITPSAPAEDPDDYDAEENDE